MYEWIQVIRQAMSRLVRIINATGVKQEDLKVGAVPAVVLESSDAAHQPEEVIELIRKSTTLILRKHQIDKKVTKDCFLGACITNQR